MPNLLDKLNLEALSDVEQPETSLVDLLLEGAQTARKQIPVEVASTQQSKKNQAGKTSRSSRKKSSRRANTKQKARRAPPMQRSAQLTLSSELQERNKRSLEMFRSSTTSTRLRRNTTSFVGSIDQVTTTEKSDSKAKVEGVEVPANMRPSIIALMDFLPIADTAGQPNTVSNVINLKLAARQLALENLPEEVMAAEQATVSLPYLDEYKKFLKYREQFLDYLDVEKIGDDDGATYKDALSFFEISTESASSATNTPILLTFLRDYANAVMTASPRLLESAEVEFAGGTALAPRRSTNGFRVALQSSMDYITTSLGDDREIALKSLVYQLGSELKLSRNKHEEPFDASEILETPLGRGTMLPSAMSVASVSDQITAAKTDSFGIINSIKDGMLGNTSYEFPFERQDILGLSAPQGSEILSAPDFIRQLLAAPTSSEMKMGAGKVSSGIKASAASLARGTALDRLGGGSTSTGTTSTTTPGFFSVSVSAGSKAESGGWGASDTSIASSFSTARDAMGLSAGSTQQGARYFTGQVSFTAAGTLIAGKSFTARTSTTVGSRAPSASTSASSVGGMSGGISAGALGSSGASQSDQILYLDPYTTINTRALVGIFKMEELTDNSGFGGSGGYASTIIMRSIINTVVQPLVSRLFSGSVLDTLALIQLMFLDLCAIDEEMMGQLMLYLASLEDKLNEPVFQESTSTVPIDTKVETTTHDKSKSSAGESWLDQASAARDERMAGTGDTQSEDIAWPTSSGGGATPFRHGFGMVFNPAVSTSELAAVMSTPTSKTTVSKSEQPVTDLGESVGFSNPQTSSTSTTGVASKTTSGFPGAARGSTFVQNSAKQMVATVQRASASGVAGIRVPRLPDVIIETPFDMLCATLGASIYQRLYDAAGPVAITDATADLWSITPENITIALKNQAKSPLLAGTTTALQDMLVLFDDVVHTIEGATGKLCFHSRVDPSNRQYGEEVSRYSSIPRVNMKAAFFQAVARTANVIFHNKYTAVKTLRGLSISVKSSMSDRLGGRLSTFANTQSTMTLTTSGLDVTTAGIMKVQGMKVQGTIERSQSSLKVSSGLREITTGIPPVDSVLDVTTAVEDETAVVTRVFDRVYNAILEEEKFVEDFPGKLRTYFSNIDTAFTSCKTILADGISTNNPDTLKSLTREGLEISPDMYTNLHNLQAVANSEDGMLNGVRTRELLLSDTAKSFLAGQLKAPFFTQASGDLKFMAVGLPAGMLEALSFNPVAITDLARNKSRLSKDYFEIRIEKIDLTRADRNYKPKKFVFPRRVLYNSWNSSGGGPSSETGTSFPEVMIAGKRMKYDVYHEDTYASNKTSDNVEFLQNHHSASIINLKNDCALKLYSDALFNLDFSTFAFPAAARALDLTFSPTTLSLNMSLVDTTSKSFMSKSCLAFAPVGQNTMSDFNAVMAEGKTTGGLDVPILKFASYGKMALAGTPGSTLSLAAYPVYSLVSSVGDTVTNGVAEQTLRLGTTFERIFCLPFDPYDFEVELLYLGEDARKLNLTNQKLDSAEKEVPYGLETSQGVELCTFRVSVVIPDEGEYEQ